MPEIREHSNYKLCLNASRSGLENRPKVIVAII